MQVIILGNGAEVPNILDIIADRPELSLTGILDDSYNVENGHIIGRLADARRYHDHCFILGINSLRNRFFRLKLGMEQEIAPEKFLTLVHPKATISPSAVLGHGVIVQAGTVIGCNVKIGAGSYLSPLCVIGHDTELGVGNILASGALLAGRVRIGAANYIGMGACIREELVIGHGNVIGMGAAVIRNIADGDTVVGVPASRIGHETLPDNLNNLIAAWNKE